MIVFNCPDCGKEFKSKDEYAGRQFNCSNCGKDIRIPSLEQLQQESPIATGDPMPRKAPPTLPPLKEFARTPAKYQDEPDGALFTPPENPNEPKLIALSLGSWTRRLPIQSVSKIPRKQKIASVIVLLGLAITVALYIPASVTPPKFNASDPQETSRWFREILVPLNSISEGMNDIARNDVLRTAMAKIKDKTDPLVGQAVVWEMGCRVRDSDDGKHGYIHITPNMFGSDGLELSAPRTSPFVTIVLGSNHKKHMRAIDDYYKNLQRKETKDTDTTPPSALIFNFFTIDVHEDVGGVGISRPGYISRSAAAKLPERAIVKGRIGEVEFGKYRDKMDVMRFVVYVYLVDVEVVPK